MIREPVVSGAFYPGSREVLQQELEDKIILQENKKRVTGLVSPHAGYVYSGGCAGIGFGQVEIPGTVIILGVNHHGFGHPYAVDGYEGWRTPLGIAVIDESLRDDLVADTGIFGIDSTASSREHSLEVQVPFIQYLNPESKILPITISSYDPETLIAGGKELAHLIKDRSDVLIVASTDMSHYIDADAAKRKDDMAIKKILALDPDGLFETVADERISMCGVAPTTMMLAAALELGAEEARVFEYTHSGKTSGDYDQVVGYLSLAVY
jgi:AmmeMemoRadiSam system protein B